MDPWDDEFDKLLRAHLPSLDGSGQIPPDVDLVSLGVESIALLQFMLALEQTYQIKFPMDMLTEEVFRTARTIWTAVSALRERGA